MADKRLIPDGIRDTSTETFNELIDRLGSLDLSPLLIYLIDAVDSSALPHLSEQFHVAGLEGWSLARTDTEKRTLIKKAIELHRYRGTPWAVKEAIKACGYADAVITEGFPSLKYDGTCVHDGSESYLSGIRWALFSVLIDIGESKSLTHDDISKLISLINEYKNVRSHLKGVSFKSTVEDRFSDLIDTVTTALLYAAEDIKPWGLRYDSSIKHNQAGRRIYDGAVKYNAQARYDEWDVSGKRYDNEWDVMANILLGISADDNVEIQPRYDGHLMHLGFTYGSDAPFAIDAAMPMIITRHIRHDSKYNYGGIYYNGAFKFNGSKAYFGGIYYQGNIKMEEVVI